MTSFLARATQVAGIVLLLGGTAHTGAVLRRFAHDGTPEGHRAAYLLFIGFIHWACGALDVIASGGLRRGEAWARGVLTVSGLLLTGYGAAVSPILVRGPLGLRVMPIAYPAVHLVLIAVAWRGARSRRA